MSRHRVDPRRVKVVQMKDGTQYRPSRDGYVSVAARHEAEMAGSGARRDHYEAQIEPIRLTVPGGEGRVCDACGFNAWPWQRTCPKCGGSLRDK